MKENMREHLFILGELRSLEDPFKSQWRLDLERGRAEEEAAEKAGEEFYAKK